MLLTTLFIGCSTTLLKPVFINWGQVERFYACTRQKNDQVAATGVNNVVLHPVNSIVNNVVEPC